MAADTSSQPAEVKALELKEDVDDVGPPVLSGSESQKIERRFRDGLEAKYQLFTMLRRRGVRHAPIHFLPRLASH